MLSRLPLSDSSHDLGCRDILRPLVDLFGSIVNAWKVEQLDAVFGALDELVFQLSPFETMCVRVLVVGRRREDEGG